MAIDVDKFPFNGSELVGTWHLVFRDPGFAGTFAYGTRVAGGRTVEPVLPRVARHFCAALGGDVRAAYSLDADPEGVLVLGELTDEEMAELILGEPAPEVDGEVAGGEEGEEQEDGEEPAFAEPTAADTAHELDYAVVEAMTVDEAYELASRLGVEVPAGARRSKNRAIDALILSGKLRVTNSYAPSAEEPKEG